MNLVIEASNIRGGGGVTHLVELLKSAEPSKFGFNSVYLISVKSTLDKIEDRSWLVKYNSEKLEKSTFERFSWQLFNLNELLKKWECDQLFIPGGTYFGSWRPFVTMSQNLLPFEYKELKRYGFSLLTLKFLLLRFTQSFTFKKSHGVIFLTEYAQQSVLNLVNKQFATTIIPHGINTRFSSNPKIQKNILEYNHITPYRILYVSSIDVYKHQSNVVKAVSILYKQGFPVFLDLVGPAEQSPLRKLKATINDIDDADKFVYYHGALPHEELNDIYKKADLCVFASSCETFGQIVTEAMSAGLPIACSQLSAMPEILGDAGLYFDPENPIEISEVIKTYINNTELRLAKAYEGNLRSKIFSWKRCADETFKFLSDNIVLNSK